MTTTQELEARLQNLLDISNAQRNAAMSDWHRLEAELIKERANSARLLEALKQCFDYPEEVFEIHESTFFPMTVSGEHLQLVASAIKQAGEAK